MIVILLFILLEGVKKSSNFLVVKYTVYLFSQYILFCGFLYGMLPFFPFRVLWLIFTQELSEI